MSRCQNQDDNNWWRKSVADKVREGDKQMHFGLKVGTRGHYSPVNALRAKGMPFTFLFRVCFSGCGQDVLPRGKFLSNKAWLYAHKITVLDSKLVKMKREKMTKWEQCSVGSATLTGRQTVPLLWDVLAVSICRHTLLLSDWNFHLSCSLLIITTVWSGLSTKELRSPLAPLVLLKLRLISPGVRHRYFSLI